MPFGDSKISLSGLSSANFRFLTDGFLVDEWRLLLDIDRRDDFYIVGESLPEGSFLNENGLFDRFFSLFFVFKTLTFDYG